MSKSDPFVVHKKGSREDRSQELTSEIRALKIRRQVLFWRGFFWAVIGIMVALALTLLPGVAWIVVGQIAGTIVLICAGIGICLGVVYVCHEYGEYAKEYKRAKKRGVVEDE